jgi:hypothetical protein
MVRLSCTRIAVVTAAAILLLSCAIASAFAPQIHPTRRSLSLSTPLLSATENDDDDDDDGIIIDASSLPPSTTMVAKNIATGEVKEMPFYDPYMEANTDATMISPWAAILFGFPTILLLNDAFHFLPQDGVLGQIQQVFR